MATWNTAISFEVKGMDGALHVLNRNIGAILQPGLRNAALHVEHEMKKYPRPQPGVLATRGTPAQRRAFFAKMRHEFNGDWKRTGTLGRNWQWKFTDGIMGTYGAQVYNPTTYAHWVQSRKYQANIHRGVWRTDEDVLRDSRGVIIREIETALRRGFNG